MPTVVYEDDKLLAAELVAVLKLDAGLISAFPSILVGKEGEERSLPSLTLFGEYQNYPAARKGTLDLLIRSAAGSDTPHSTLFALVLAKFFGDEKAGPRVTAAAALAALQAALTARGAVNLIALGYKTILADTDGSYLRTQITVNVAWQFL